MEKPRLGIYIHIPFCASKCGYCDFYSLAGCEAQMPIFHKALIDHLLESAKAYGKSPYGLHLKAVADGKLRY